MIPREIFEILVCPSCGADAIRIGGGRYPELECTSCEAVYPIVEGIPDLTPRRAGQPARHYRTEALYDAIAPIVDYVIPAVSLGLWKCPPLRYVDWCHRAFGRAQGGRLLVNPVGTGLLIKHVWGGYIDFPVVAVDTSWKMLKRAQARFERRGTGGITFIRAEPENLPFAEDSFSAVLSINGLNGFHDREAALGEMIRIARKDGVIAGSTLCRGLERAADRMLNQYERWGIYPILRSREYLVRELIEAFEVSDVTFETYGAAMFYLVELSHQIATAPG
jgi:SAM-dependent methyltransferase